MRSFLLLIVTCIFFSCSSNKEKMLPVVSELETELKHSDSLYVKLTKNPDDSLLAEIGHTLNRVKSVLADTMSPETEKMLEDYLEIESSLQDYSGNIDSLKKEIEYSKKQVESLKADVQNSSISYPEFEKHAEREMEALQMIQRNEIKMDEWFQSARSTILTANELLNIRISADSLLNHH